MQYFSLVAMWMRPSRQRKVITSHLEGFMNLKEQLEILQSNINNIIIKSENWLQEKNQSDTFSEINQYLDLEMEVCLKTLCSIIDENDTGIQKDQFTKQECQEKKPSNVEISKCSSITQESKFLTGDSDVHSTYNAIKDLKENISTLNGSVGQNEDSFFKLNKKYETLSKSSDIMAKQIKSFQEKYKAQTKHFESMNKQITDTDIKYNLKFEELWTEIHLASNFIQSQTEMFSEKVNDVKEKCSTELNQKLKNIQLELKNHQEMNIKRQEEHEKATNENVREIKTNIQTYTKIFDELKQDKELSSSQERNIQRNISLKPIERETKEFQSTINKHDMVLNEQVTSKHILVNIMTDINEKNNGTIKSRYIPRKSIRKPEDCVDVAGDNNSKPGTQHSDHTETQSAEDEKNYINQYPNFFRPTPPFPRFKYLQVPHVANTYIPPKIIRGNRTERSVTSPTSAPQNEH